VHQLIHFADLRNFYKDMREALKSANRRAGAQQGLVTKARKKIEALELDLAAAQQEKQELLAYRQRVEQEASQLAELLPRLKGRMLQMQQIEQALSSLADVKEAVDQQDQKMGSPTLQSMQDLERGRSKTCWSGADAIDFFEGEASEADA
jgi:chromosome segregation ATPase